jgi:PAS domain S-box-containing protein
LADTAARTETTPSLRREAILEAVAYTAERLLLTPDWRDAADSVLTRLGEATDVSRCYIMENSDGGDGRLLTTVVFEWNAPGVVPQIAVNPFLDESPWDDGYQRWASAHARGEPVASTVKDLPPSERPELERQGILSILEYPVFVGEEWWGCIGFDDCVTAREWSAADIDSIRAASTVLAAAIQRRRSDQQLREAEERYRTFVELIPAVTYTDVPTDGRMGMGFVSPQIVSMLGYEPERFTEDPTFWFSLIHPDDRARLDTYGAFDPSDQSAFDDEYRMRASNGSWVWVHDISTPVLGPDGTISYFMGFMTEITQRKSAEERLRSTEERFRVLIEQMPAVTYTHTVEENGTRAVDMDYVSPQVETLAGYPVETWLGTVNFYRQITHPDDIDRLEDTIERANADGSPMAIDYRILRPDGETVWVHEEALLIRNVPGRSAYWQGFMLDITERRHAEEQVAAGEARYRLLVEQTPAITYQELPTGASYEPDSTLLYVSPQVSSILGYDAELWATSPGFWMRVVHPDDIDRVLAHGNATSISGESFGLDYRMIAADGRVLWFHDESHLIRDSQGEPLIWQGVMLDITERKEAETRLREAEERYRVLVEHIPAIIYAEPIPWDVERWYVSPQVEEILGYTADDWRSLESFWKDRIHPDDLDGVLEANRHANSTGESFLQEYRFRRSDGSYIWLHDEAVRVADADGNPLFWQGVFVDITARKVAESQQHQAEERFRTLVEHMPAIVYAQGLVPETDDLYLSPQVQEILGYSAEDWRSTLNFWSDLLHPDDRERALAETRRTDQTGEDYIDEYRLRAADGEYRLMHDEAALVLDENGAPLYWQGAMFDITERRAAEEQLREAEARYRAVVEHIPAIIYVESLDADPERLYLSPQLETMLGYTIEEWTWTPGFWIDHVHPDDRERVAAIDAASNQSREAFAMEYRLQIADGSWIWIHDEATYLNGPGGDDFWQGFMLDVTARKEAETQLRSAEEKFRSIVEQNQAVFYIQEIDPVTQISRTTYVAPGHSDLVGYDAQQVEEDPELWLRIVHPDDRERVRNEDRATNASDVGQQVSMEYRIIHRDGRTVWIQDEARLVQTGDEPMHWQGFLLDVTGRKEAEEQLARALEVERDAAQQLRALDEMKNTFLQAVSHDLRTPLAAILGLAITLERGDVELSEDDAKDLARRIADNSRRLDRLVTNLLDLDRLARGIVAPKLHNADVGALVRRLLAESELIAGSRLQTDIQPVVIPIDSAKVERIVENLLANTVRHTPSNATIWVSVAPVEGGALLKVEDDGPGVSPDLREVIFEPFQQGPDAPQHSPGVGVGLTLVRRFAELHAGRAWVEERPGGGASFRVFLPVVPPETPKMLSSL